MKPGTMLGPYEVLAPLGVGGMGEVYKARDTRLGRTVAVRFDLATLTPIGRPVPVASGVYGRPYGGAGYASFGVSHAGALVFAAGEYVPLKGVLVWLDRQGRVEPLDNTARSYAHGELTLSQDGQKLATSIMERDYVKLWIFHIADQRWQHLAGDADDSDPVWSPTGDRLAFASNRDGPPTSTSRIRMKRDESNV